MKKQNNSFLGSLRPKLRKARSLLVMAGMTALVLLSGGIRASAAPKEYWPTGIDTGAPHTGTSLDNNPYVTWSPDYTAWTLSDASFGPYDKHFPAWSDFGDTKLYYHIYTGVTGVAKTAPTGYHIYKEDLPNGTVIPIREWRCSYSRSNCIQSPPIGIEFAGMHSTTPACGIEHHPGWIAVCANCGEDIHHLIYASDAAIESMKSMPAGMNEFYICPRTNKYDSKGHPTGGHFEQGAPIGHKCNEISPNRYTVKYMANYPASSIPGYNGTGYTAATLHIYDNKSLYEGVAGNYATTLRKNSFEFHGYRFTGWNTKPDGTGTKYSDGQAVLNLTSVDNGIVTLYAQWAPSSGSLVIDPNGGKFDGSPAVQTFTGTSGSTFNASSSRVTPPQGVNITFVTNGGSACAPMRNTMKFTTWKSGALYGTLASNKTYTYPKKDGVTDKLTATYEYQAITLPTTTWANHSFSGWFFDAAFTKPAGSPGDKIVVTKDTVIYAQWAELILKSVDNYSVYGGAGAVNLSWSQKDNYQKVYKLWQSTNGNSWTQLYSATETSHDPIEVASGKNAAGSTYTVEASGIYDLSISGAQGGNYNGKSGGKGGQVDVRVYLKKGDTVTYYVGGQDGSLGGGSGNMGNGGGYSIVYINGSPIALAGGGGGANTDYDGGAGGLSTGTDASTNTGKSPTDGKGSGGGGGYAAGNAGTYIPAVMAWKLDELELVPGQKYNMNFEYPSVLYSGKYNVRFTPKYVYNPDTGEIIHEFNNHGFYMNGSAPYIHINDHLSYNGQNYYLIVSPDKYDELYANEVSHAQEYNHPILPTQISPWEIEHINSNTIRLLYCGKDDAGNEQHGSFGNCYPGVPGPSYHGLVSEWHCNGHLTFGRLVEYVKVPASIEQAYGGSSHVYTDSHIVSSSTTAGAKTGDGSFSLKSVVLGFQDDMYLNNVKAYDRARPDRIDTKAMTHSLSGNNITYYWNEPNSNGTTYYHKAQSFQAGSNSVLCESNITENTLTSRITGYYYRLDQTSYGELSTSDAKQTERSMTITIQDYDQWLHIAAVDAAGNIAPAIHIKITKKPGPGDTPVRWNLHTDQIIIAGTDNNVYHAHDKTYYVRADCVTPFSLSGSGYMDGKPYDGYVMNGYGFVSDSGSKSGGAFLQVQKNADGPISDIGQWSDSAPVLDPYIGYGASYSGGRTILSGNSNFTMADGYDGVSIKVWPRAYARYMEQLHEMTNWSDNAADKNNGLILIGDARPPVIHGLDVLEGIEIIDKGSNPVIVDIWCEDSGSGVGGFTVTVTNQDTGDTRTFESNGEHLIINVTGDDPIWIGDFTVTVDAHDNVWNTSTATTDAREFELTAWITRILSPHDPKFREGESGILHVKTKGFADRIEVTFPVGLESYTQVIDYENDREFEKNDEIQFMIPLYYMRDYFDGADHVDNVPLTVKAYKGSQELTATPKMSVFNLANTVLEEFRDRLK